MAPMAWPMSMPLAWSALTAAFRSSMLLSTAASVAWAVMYTWARIRLSRATRRSAAGVSLPFLSILAPPGAAFTMADAFGEAAGAALPLGALAAAEAGA